MHPPSQPGAVICHGGRLGPPALAVPAARTQAALLSSQPRVSERTLRVAEEGGRADEAQERRKERAQSGGV